MYYTLSQSSFPFIPVCLINDSSAWLLLSCGVCVYGGGGEGGGGGRWMRSYWFSRVSWPCTSFHRWQGRAVWLLDKLQHRFTTSFLLRTKVPESDGCARPTISVFGLLLGQYLITTGCYTSDSSWVIKCTTTTTATHDIIIIIIISRFVPDPNT